MGMILVTASVAVFVWAVVGLRRKREGCPLYSCWIFTGALMTSLICWKSVSTAVLRGTIINYSCEHSERLSRGCSEPINLSA